MRLHRFFIGQDLAKITGDSVVSSNPVEFDFDPEQVDFATNDVDVADVFSGNTLSREVVIAHQQEVVRQWKKVFRYQVGDSLRLFDGKIEILVKISELSKENDIVRFIFDSKIGDFDKNIKNNSQIWLAPAILKGEHIDMVVEKATELNVAGVILVQTDRVIKKGVNLGRLQKIAIESAEQCGRIDVPIITTINNIDLILGQANKFNFDKKLIFNMGGSDIQKLIENNDLEKNSARETEKILLCVGPEGGWSNEEGEYFKKLEKTGKINIVSLGNNVLRAETASIVGLSAFYLNQL